MLGNCPAVKDMHHSQLGPILCNYTYVVGKKNNKKDRTVQTEPHGLYFPLTHPSQSHLQR